MRPYRRSSRSSIPASAACGCAGPPPSVCLYAIRPTSPVPRLRRLQSRSPAVARKSSWQHCRPAARRNETPRGRRCAGIRPARNRRECAGREAMFRHATRHSGRGGPARGRSESALQRRAATVAMPVILQAPARGRPPRKDYDASCAAGGVGPWPALSRAAPGARLSGVNLGLKLAGLPRQAMGPPHLRNYNTSRASAWWRTSMPFTRNSTSSAILVAWSATRSRFWAMNSRLMARWMVVRSSCMKRINSL
jgi:hypothetical protein